MRLLRKPGPLIFGGRAVKGRAERMMSGLGCAVRVQSRGDQPGYVHKSALVREKQLHRRLVGGVQHHTAPAAFRERLPGQPQAGKSLLVRFMRGTSRFRNSSNRLNRALISVLGRLQFSLEKV